MDKTNLEEVTVTVEDNLSELLYDGPSFGEVEYAYNAGHKEELDALKETFFPTEDVVNHPKHYISKNGIETIDVIDAWTEGLEGIVAVDTANVIKYISRWHKKNGIEDLKKARWYLNHLISEIERRMKEDSCVE